jgi:MSHA biogenesis protein MshK
MVERLNSFRLVGIAFAVAVPLAQAQALSDPTRPPGAAAMASPDAPQATELQLQTILLSPQRKLAVINGQTVKIGERVGDATLVTISETGVVLKRGEETQTVRLLPGLERKPAGRNKKKQEIQR